MKPLFDVTKENFNIDLDSFYIRKIGKEIGVYSYKDGSRIFGMELSVLDTLIATFLTSVHPDRVLVDYLDNGLDFLESNEGANA